MEGDIYPRRHNFSKRYELGADNSKLYSELKKPKHKIICINDSRDDYDFAKIQHELISIFEEKLPCKCEYEKD